MITLSSRRCQSSSMRFFFRSDLPPDVLAPGLFLSEESCLPNGAKMEISNFSRRKHHGYVASYERVSGAIFESMKGFLIGSALSQTTYLSWCGPHHEICATESIPVRSPSLECPRCHNWRNLGALRIGIPTIPFVMITTVVSASLGYRLASSLALLADSNLVFRR